MHVRKHKVSHMLYSLQILNITYFNKNLKLMHFLKSEFFPIQVN